MNKVWAVRFCIQAVTDDAMETCPMCGNAAMTYRIVNDFEGYPSNEEYKPDELWITMVTDCCERIFSRRMEWSPRGIPGMYRVAGLHFPNKRSSREQDPSVPLRGGLRQ